FRRAIVEEIRITSEENSGQDRLVLAEIYLGLGKPSVAVVPDFGSHLTGIYEMNSPEFGTAVTAAGSKNQIPRMYRSPDRREEVENQPWAFDFVDPLSQDSRAFVARYCQFRILSSGKAARRGWRNLRVSGGELSAAPPEQPRGGPQSR